VKAILDRQVANLVESSMMDQTDSINPSFGRVREVLVISEAHREALLISEVLLVVQTCSEVRLVVRTIIVVRLCFGQSPKLAIVPQVEPNLQDLFEFNVTKNDIHKFLYKYQYTSTFIKI